MSNSDQYGKLYVFGIGDADAPAIQSFVARTAEFRVELGTHAEARNYQGIVKAVTTELAEKRKVVGRFTGYILDGFVGADPTFTIGTRTFIITSVSQAKRKGDFAEVTIEAESYDGVI